MLHHWDAGKNKADNILINGRGRIEPDQREVNIAISSDNKLPLATFFVTKGIRYRFRIVSPGFTLCPIQVSIQSHSMIIIASDTAPVKPIEVQALIVHPGERLVHVLPKVWPSQSFYYPIFCILNTMNKTRS